MRSSRLIGSDGDSFDKYDLYTRAVQSPHSDVRFIARAYASFQKNSNKHKKEELYFREDFCGSFALSCEWVKLKASHHAIALDIDPEPLDYGRKHYIQGLRPDQQFRLDVRQMSVLDNNLPEADIVAAMNFSYFLFKDRTSLKKYFENVYNSLKPGGVFVTDLFGGSLCGGPNEEKTIHKGFTYYWDQASFDPISNQALFHIHFRFKGQRWERVFTYDWRMWSIPELRDLMEEVGFYTTKVYWEGTTKDGRGNGVFRPREKGEACQSWIAYLVGGK